MTTPAPARRVLRTTRATRRWVLTLILLALGVGGGLYLGWMVAPVPVANTTLDSLAPPYRAEYVRLTAHAYRANGDLTAAQSHLQALGVEAATVRDLFAADLAARAPITDLQALAVLARALNVETPAMQAYLP